jgi:hypothetical protein
MGRAIAVLAGSAANVPPFNAIGSVIAHLWREVRRSLVGGGYRPERHYMRGPGPAWRAKHGMH